MRILLMVVLFGASLFAIDTGELSFYLMKDGKPMADQKVVIFKKVMQQTAGIKGFGLKQAEFTTDNDGYVYSILPIGNFQIQVIAVENGVPKAFFRKNFMIKKGKESQVIVSLKEDNTLAFEDDEAPKIAVIENNASKADIKANGVLMMTLVSSEDQTPVSGARVFVKGQKVDVKTNAKGFVDLNLPAGEQTVSIIHSKFSSQTFKVKVMANESVSKHVELSPASMELEEFVVLAPHVEGSVASVIAEERNSDAVGNVLGSEQFAKSGDSSVASALKRVSGITIVGGKYVYVRGLGDRYSTVMLNDLHVPSPEPTKRVVPLDIFPTSVVQSITIQKSYTGDLPASFGGGTVLIKSKDIPEKDDGYASLGLEVLVNSSTGQDVTTNADNSTPLPKSALADGNLVGGRVVTQDVIKSRSLNHEQISLAPGFKGEVSAGKSFGITDDLTLGASGTVYYKQTSENIKTQYDKYFYDINSKKVFHDNHTDADVTTFNTELAGMLNVGADYFEHNKIKYTFFTSQHTSNRTTLSSIDYVGATDDREKTYYEYVEKGLISNQLSGVNDLHFSNTTDGYFDNLKIDWAVENSTANRDEPGTVEYNYLHQSSGLNWDRKNWYYYFILKDQVSNYRADLSLPFELNDNDNYTQAGVFIYNKSRDFDSRRFKILSSNFDEVQDDMDTVYSKYERDLDFSASYRDTDSYHATQDVTAFYLKQLLSVTHDFDIVASARYEDSSQQLSDAAAVYDPLVTKDVFPSLGVTYRFDKDDMQLRFAYASTISRPDFREFSNSRYKDPITENIVFGNPKLQATYINHYDLKYEWYMSADQVFSFALFAKEFKNPIEKVIKLDDSQDNTFQETYQNAESAVSYGVEMDYRKRFGFITSSLDKLLFATNVALIQSNIKLNQDPTNDFTSRLTTTERPMQGQSPYVANFILGYDDMDRGDSALFLFNQIGKRIVALGTDKNEDIYEAPFAKLDFVTQWKLNNYYLENSDFTYMIKFKAENLLDSSLKYTQGDLITATAKPGREFSLSLKIAY